MSHKSKFAMKIKDIKIFKKTLKKLGIEFTENDIAQMYGSQTEKARIAFKLPGWRYAIAVNDDGEIIYDHFGSEYDSFKHLGKTVQAYNIAAITSKANQHVSTYYQNKLKDGSVRLVLEF